LAIPTSTPGAPKRINADFGSVVIDGDFSDWGASFMALDTGSAFYIRHPEAISGPADTSVLIQARWDETHLYFAFDVRDEQMIVDSSDIWKDDGIEIGLDGENDNDAWSSSGGDLQFTIRFDGQAADRTLAIHNPDVKWAVQRTDIGYRVEMAAPLEELGVDSLFSGQVLGVDFAVNDDDDGGERDSQLNWASTTTYSDASGFVDLVLSGGPSSSTATSTPIPTSTPGASKRIRAQRGSAEIDGDLQEWTEPSMSLDTGSAQRVDSPEAIDSPADSSALIWARWDDDFIYLAFDVRDDVIKTDSRNLWKDDSIEIGVDGEDDDEAWSSSGGDHQFTIRSDGQAADRTLAIGAKDVKWAVKANEHGYQAEIAIPLSALGVDRLTAGQQIGIDFAINDDDSGGYRDSQLVWSSLSTYSDAPGFGVLILY
jgi:endo-1,4-beta-xylanase